MIKDVSPTYEELLQHNPRLKEIPISRLNDLLSVLNEYDYQWEPENQYFINHDMQYIINVDSLHQLSAENIRKLTNVEVDFKKSHPIMVKLTRFFGLLSFIFKRYSLPLFILILLFGWLIIPFSQILIVTLFIIVIGISIVGVSHLLNKSLEKMADSHQIRM